MAESKSNQGRSASMKVDTRLVRELAELLAETGLTEIEVEDGERKIRVARGAFSVAAATPAHAPAAPANTALAAPGEPSEASPHIHANALRSPMVGTCYLSAEPGTEAFVREGDRVKAGDTLLIVEAMKVMNPIPAPSDGVVREILVENAQPVEFDQPLIVLG